MDVNGVISLYTTLFGWQFYDILWKILVGTGIVYIPILAVIISSVLSARASGSLLKNDAESVLSVIEVSLFRMLLVMLLAAIPTGATTLDGSQLTYNGATVSSTDSTYDSSFGTSPLVTAASIQVPAWWYGVMAVSQGMTKAVVTAAGDTPKFRDLQMAVNVASIRDPEIRYNLQVFSNECHTPARSKLFVDNGRGDITDQQVHWPGSAYFINTPGYYDSLKTQTPLPGYPFTAADMPEYESDAGLGGRVNCNTLWNDISTTVLAQATQDGIVGFWTELFGISDAERARIVQRYVQTERLGILNTADQINSIRNSGRGQGRQIIDKVGGYLNSFSLAGTVFVLRNAVTAVVYGSSILQSYILMVLYLYIPVALLLSGFSLTFLISGAVLIFSVTFWSALWAIAAAADNFLSSALWDAYLSQSLVDILDPENMMKDLLHSIVVLGLYILMPMAATWMLLASGSAAGRAISASTHSLGGIGAAGTAASSGGLRAGSRALGVIGRDGRPYQHPISK